MTYHLPPEELKQAAEKYAIQWKTQASSEGLQNIATDFTSGCDHTMQNLTPTLDKALEALESVETRINKLLIVCWPFERRQLEEELAKITEAINELKKMKG